MLRAPVFKAGWLLAASLVGACVALAAFGERLPEQPVVELPHVLERERFLQVLSSTGKHVGQLGTGYRLYENTAFGFRVRVARQTTVPLSVVGRGHASEGVYPYLAVRVNGQTENGFYVTSSDWSSYTLPVELAPGEHAIELAYINDKAGFPEARNLDLRGVQMGSMAQDPMTKARWIAPGDLDPAKMAYRAFAVQQADGFHVWNQGAVSDDVYFASSGSYQLQLQLRRPSNTKSVGLLRLSVDGRPIEEAPIAAGSSVHDVWLDLERGYHRLRWSYRTSAHDAPASKDLTIQRIRVGAFDRMAGSSSAGLRLSGTHVELAGSALQSRSSGEAHGDVWSLWQNGVLKQGLTEGVGRWRLTLRARGDVCEQRGPRLLVMMDQEQLTSLAIDDIGLRDYVFPVHLTRDQHELVLIYDNDEVVTDGCDRNLHIERISFDRELF